MNLKIYAMRDNKAACFMARPFFHLSKFDAIRDIREALTKDNQISKYPEDYDLYEIGEYDPQNGSLNGIKSGPEFIASVAGLVELNKTQNKEVKNA